MPTLPDGIVVKEIIANGRIDGYVAVDRRSGPPWRVCGTRMRAEAETMASALATTPVTEWWQEKPGTLLRLYATAGVPLPTANRR